MPRLIVVAGDTFPVLWIADYKAVIATMLIDKFALIGFKEALAGIIFYIDINAEARFVPLVPGFAATPSLSASYISF